MLRRGGKLFCVVLALLVTTTCSPRGPRKLNLVVIALDTLRPDHLGCYGDARATSPNIDAWSKNAVLFENAQSAAPWTAPSLLSLMTSLYPDVHHVMSFPEPGQMSDNVTTLAEMLKKVGYRTAACTDGGYASPFSGLKQGFDYYPLNEGDVPRQHASNIAHPDRVKGNIDRALAWLELHEDDPFFLFFHTYQIHAPYCPPPEYTARFRRGYDEYAEHAHLSEIIDRWKSVHDIDAEGVKLILAHNLHCGSGNGDERVGLPAKMKEFGIGSLDEDRMQFWRDLYDGEIAYTDFELKRLLDALEKPQLRDNTVVVFVSDHGEGFGEHGTTQHGSVLFEEDLHVLFMLRAPGVAPSRVKDLVRSIDMMPTSLELLGVAFDKTRLQGRSLVPLMRGEKLPAEPTFSHAMNKNGHEANWFTIRDGKWRFVWDDDDNTGALYDLESDPGELHDVAAQNRKIAERLQGLLNAQRGVDAELAKRVSGPVGAYKLDEDLRKQLRDQLHYLGYVGDDPPPAHDDKSK
jgi:arylsulfatase A-like enzyme